MHTQREHDSTEKLLNECQTLSGESLVTYFREQASNVLSTTGTESIDQEIFRIRRYLHQLGLALTRTGEEDKYGVELVDAELPPIQYLVGIGSNPNSFVEINENLQAELRIAHDEAVDDGRLRKVIIYDSPQKENYINFGPRTMGKSCTKRRASRDGSSLEDAAKTIAAERGDRYTERIQTFLKENELSNIHVVQLSQLEATHPLYNMLRATIYRIILNDEFLKNQLINTLEAHHLHKGGIGIHPQMPNPKNEEEVRWKLAQYSLPAVVLQILNLGDTIIHPGEIKNSRLTRTILRNTSYRRAIQETFERYGESVSDEKLRDLCENGFIRRDSFEDAY